MKVRCYQSRGFSDYTFFFLKFISICYLAIAIVATKANTMSSISYKYILGPTNGCNGGLGLGFGKGPVVVVEGVVVVYVPLLMGCLMQLSTEHKQ